MDLAIQPLDEAEMDELDRFLLYRGESETDDTYVEDSDEGILTLSELDGFFTAIVSGPQMIVPSRWLPAVWGDEPPVWESPEAFERIFTLLVRHMNGTVSALMSPEHEFEPIFMEHEVEGKRYTLVQEWCMGYMRGVGLAQELWEKGGDEMLGLMMPIDLFTNEWGWKILEKLSEEEREVMKVEIAPAARAIHSYWLGRRDTGSEPFVRDTPKAGRNDPCPCGSGKKYKVCCLH